MEIGKKFASLDTYNENMAKGLEDKLFFLNQLPEPTLTNRYLFVDFGCADGTLVNALYRIMGDKNWYVGYDISEQMIDLARTKMNDSPDCVVFTSDWGDVMKSVAKFQEWGCTTKRVLILSSVIHEKHSARL